MKYLNLIRVNYYQLKINSIVNHESISFIYCLPGIFHAIETREYQDVESTALDVKVIFYECECIDIIA